MTSVVHSSAASTMCEHHMTCVVIITVKTIAVISSNHVKFTGKAVKRNINASEPFRLGGDGLRFL